MYGDIRYLIDVTDGSLKIDVIYQDCKNTAIMHRIGTFIAPHCPDTLTETDARQIASRISELALYVYQYEKGGKND